MPKGICGYFESLSFVSPLRLDMRSIEFFAGIGGFAWAAKRAWPNQRLENLAIDIDRDARMVYELNHAHPVLTREIESLSIEVLAEAGHDLWWMSPPCQPYSRRGQQRDTQDPRAASLLFLIKQVERALPAAIALENVEGFAHSHALELLLGVLQSCGYFVQYRLLCPTDMGWPNRRPRFYLLAGRQPLIAWTPLPYYRETVAEIIHGVHLNIDACAVDADVIEKFSVGLDRVDPNHPDAVTACFGSSYGKSILHAGSYCLAESSYRRFSPAEVAALLGFPKELQLPEAFTYRRLWKLLGNSLSIPAVEYVLKHLPI